MPLLAEMTVTEATVLISAIATPIITLAGMIISYLRLKHGLDENTKATEEVRHNTNALSQELQVREHERGVTEGIAEEKARVVTEDAAKVAGAVEQKSREGDLLKS